MVDNAKKGVFISLLLASTSSHFCLKMPAKKQLSSLNLPCVNRCCEGIDQRLDLVML